MERKGEQWKVQLVDWLYEMQIPKAFASPWTKDPHFTGGSIVVTERVAGLLDAVVWQQLGRPAAKMTFSEKRELLKHCYVDISQNPCRRPTNNQSGDLGTMTTSSLYYSFFRDGPILPFEMLLWHGHSRLLQVPSSTKANSLKELAGEGMSAPCLGSILWAAFLVKAFS